MILMPSPALLPKKTAPLYPCLYHRCVPMVMSMPVPRTSLPTTMPTTMPTMMPNPSMRKCIQVSAFPASLNRGGDILRGCITLIDDHGYLVVLGQHMTGFLSFDNVEGDCSLDKDSNDSTAWRLNPGWFTILQWTKKCLPSRLRTPCNTPSLAGAKPCWHVAEPCRPSPSLARCVNSLFHFLN